MIADLTVLANIVLSTGGGAVLRPDNRVRLKENGTVIYLHAEPSTLYGRASATAATGRCCRPPIQLARLAELYAQRDALYRETADLRRRVRARRSDAPRAPVRSRSQHHDET